MKYGFQSSIPNIDIGQKTKQPINVLVILKSLQ